MQTFVPSTSTVETGMLLDQKRLGKQIVECRQIGLAISRGGGWANHPAVKMWAGHIGGLMLYASLLHEEWKERRGKEHLAFRNMTEDHPLIRSYDLPGWWGYEPVHASHRASLWRKDPSWYPAVWQADALRYDTYVWPTT